MKITDEENSFLRVAEDLNLTMDRVQYYWENWMAKGKKAERPDKFSSKSNPLITEIPQFDGEIQAKLVSPRKVLFFWNSSDLPKKLFQDYFNRNMDELVHIIRIYDVTQIEFNGKNAHHFYEIPIPYHQGYWFVKGLFSSRSYLGEIGVKLDAGDFFPLLRSNTVKMPKFEIGNKNDLYQDVLYLYQHEEQPPKWREYVSTYSYYSDNGNGGEKK